MKNRIFVVIITAFAAFISVPALAQQNCGSKWRSVTDTIAGATYDMAQEPRRSYFISYGDNFPSANYEQGWLDNNDCATFTVTVWDLGSNHVADTKGFFDTQEAFYTKKGMNGKIHWSRSLQVSGFPAREFLASLNIDITGDHVYYRTLVIARNNQVLQFTSHWSGGPTSPNADRSFKSITLIPVQPLEHLRSYALLSEVITKYWMFPSNSYDYSNYFSPSLLPILNARRTEDAAAMEAFGYPRDFKFVQKSAAGKVIRVKHDKATIDWTVADNGKTLTSIYYRKYDPNAVPPPISAATGTVGAAPNYPAIAAAQQRFRTSIVTAPALGTTFAVGAPKDPCITTYMVVPQGKTPEQALADPFIIDWRTAKSVNFMPGTPDAVAWWRDYVEIVNVTGGSWPLHPSKEQVGPMLAAANELMRLCKGVPKTST